MARSEKWDPATRRAVREEQLRTLYRQSVWVFLMNPINASLVSLVLWRAAPQPLLGGWVLVMAGVTVGRLLSRRSYRAASPALQQAARWRWQFVVGTTLTGLTWGIGAGLLFDPQNQVGELLLVFVVGGMMAGAAGTLAFYAPAFLGFAAGAMVPLCTRLAIEGGPTRLVMAALVVLFGLTLTMVAFNTQRALTESIRLRFVNENLLRQLTGAQDSLEESNRTLEQRVAERGAALERQSEALRQAQRMESVGLLAGGVAHDFNNLLTVVMGNVGLLSDDRSLNEPAQLAVEEIRGAASGAAGLVRQLLAFSRRQVLVPKVLDLNQVVDDMQRLLARLLGSDVNISVALVAQDAFVKIDPRQLEQVIINLATNARDAMPGGGRLTIETAAIELGAPGASGEPLGARPGAYVVLTVADSGVGMDGETRRQAFDPFFTTKEIGKGTGLGLATVHGIVEQSGGHIVVDSQPGKGSRFKIYLPAAAAGEAQLEVTDPGGAVVTPGRARRQLPTRAKILVAEDHPMVRSVLSRILGDLGYEVLLTEDGERALEVSRAHEGEIDLLVTDVVMARMGGPELVKLVAADRPRMRVLFISGYSRDAALPQSDPNEGIDFLEKPFAPAELASKVARLLSAKRPSGLSVADAGSGSVEAKQQTGRGDQ